MGPSDRALELARHIIASNRLKGVDEYTLAYSIDAFWQRERDAVIPA